LWSADAVHDVDGDAIVILLLLCQRTKRKKRSLPLSEKKAAIIGNEYKV
jgi:hypothetical protein